MLHSSNLRTFSMQYCKAKSVREINYCKKIIYSLHLGKEMERSELEKKEASQKREQRNETTPVQESNPAPIRCESQVFGTCR